jgi:hypothetical protein
VVRDPGVRVSGRKGPLPKGLKRCSTVEEFLDQWVYRMGPTLETPGEWIRLGDATADDFKTWQVLDNLGMSPAVDRWPLPKPGAVSADAQGGDDA